MQILLFPLYYDFRMVSNDKAIFHNMRVRVKRARIENTSQVNERI